MSCNNCVNGVNEPLISYAGQCITDYRSSNDRENEIRAVLEINGCKPKSSYDFKLCMQHNSESVKNYLDRSFKQSLSSNKCSR
jgi:hypothetical protein